MSQKMGSVGQYKSSDFEACSSTLLQRRRRRAPKPHYLIENKNMKKIIVITAIIGLTATVTASAAGAKQTFDKSCAMCHGADGKGHTKIGEKLGIKDFTDSKVQAGFTDDAAFKTIKEGLKDKEGRMRMKAFGNLSDAEIKALVQYVRGFKK